MKNWSKILVAILFVCAAFYFPVQAQTNVSGGIYTNTTWTLANSPYIVTDTVVVFPGVTLNIQPGVVVKCDSNVLIEIRQATLIANGTAAQPISFEANSLNAGRYFWEGVYFNSVDSIQINYSNFKNAQNAITLSVTNLAIINNCSFQSNSNSIYNNSVNYLQGSKIEIFNSSFLNNLYGVYNYASDYNFFDVENSTFNNNYDGFYFYSNSSRYSSIFKHCRFTANSNYGIEEFGFGIIDSCFFGGNGNGVNFVSPSNSGTIENSVFRNNIIAISSSSYGLNISNCHINLNQTGIQIYQGTTIKGCTIDSNKVTGINEISLGNNSFTKSYFRYNKIAMTLNTYQYFVDTISQNIIEANNIGIKGSVYDSIFCNKIFNDTLYDFYYNNTASNANYHIGKNDWNDTVVAHIRSKIYDGYVNVSLGLVNFLPIDTSQCYLTGCNLLVSANVTNPSCGTCTNGSATAVVHNGTAPYTYTWYTSPLQTAATATSLDTGTYTLCVHDANGCNACNNIVVGLGAVNCLGFAISTTSQNATCAACTDGSAKVMATGGTAPYNYTWYTSPLQTTDSAVGLSQGIYHVCVTDHYGCVLCDSATINIGNCSAHFNLLPDTILHHYFAVNMASGAAPLSYSWSWGDGTPNDTGAYPNHTYSSAGFYTICLTIIDAVSCQNTYCDSFYLLRSKNSMITVNVVPAKHATTGIEQLTNSNEQLSIYPNPTTNQLTVVGHQFSVKTIEVRNVVGQIVNCKLVFDNSTDNSKLNTANLSSGIYFLKAINDKGLQQVVKFVKE